MTSKATKKTVLPQAAKGGGKQAGMKDDGEKPSGSKSSKGLEVDCPLSKFQIYISESELPQGDTDDSASAIPHINITHVDDNGTAVDGVEGASCSNATSNSKPSNGDIDSNETQQKTRLGDDIYEIRVLPHNESTLTQQTMLSTADSLQGSTSDVEIEVPSERDVWLTPSYQAAAPKKSTSKLSIFDSHRKAINQTFGSLASGFLHVLSAVVIIALLFTMTTRREPAQQNDLREVTAYLDMRWGDSNKWNSLLWTVETNPLIQYRVLTKGDNDTLLVTTKTRQVLFWQGGGALLVQLNEEGLNTTSVILENPIHVQTTQKGPLTVYNSDIDISLLDSLEVTSCLTVNAHVNMSALLMGGSEYSLLGVIVLPD